MPTVESFSQTKPMPVNTDHFHRKQLLERIAQAIDGLSSQERLVLALHYEESLTIQEISAVLDLHDLYVVTLLEEAQGQVRRAIRIAAIRIELAGPPGAQR